MVNLGPTDPTILGINIYKHVKYIKRNLWQKLFGVKCPECGKKMFKDLTLYYYHHMYCCNDCWFIVKDYGKDNP